MSGWQLNPLSLHYQALTILAGVLSTYLFAQSRRGGRRATRDLASFLAVMTVGLLLLFLDQVFAAPGEKVFIDVSLAVFQAAGAILLAFACRFPDVDPGPRARRAVWAAWLAVVADVVLAGPNVQRSLRGVPNPRLPFRLQLALLTLTALLVLAVFVRRARRGGGLARRERGALGWFAGLVAVLFLVCVASYLANLQMIPREAFMTLRTVGLMVFLFAFVGVHLNASPEPSELMAKLVGLSLVATLLTLVLAVALLLPVRPDQFFGTVLPDDLRDFQNRRAVPLALLMLGLPALVLTLFPLLLREGLRRPLDALLAGVRRVNDGDLSVEVPVRMEDEIGYLARSFNGMVRSVREAMAGRERMAAVERELAIARRIQESLFPTDLPRVNAWEFAAGCRPAREVGGDYYDLFARDDGRVVLALGDVAGKGLGPALVMAGVRSVIRSRLRSGDADLGGLLAEINADLFESTPAEIFISLFIGVLDPATGRLRYANAGHPPPFSFAGPDSAPVKLDVRGLVAGLFPGLAYAEGLTGVDRGGVFVLYSDGLTEAFGEGEEMYEEENAVREVRAAHRLPAPDILARLFEGLERFRGRAEQSDDVTILVVRRAGPASIGGGGS